MECMKKLGFALPDILEASALYDGSDSGSYALYSLQNSTEKI